MLCDMPASTSAAVGFGFLRRSATAVMIWPDWQYPHCGTCSAIQACCTGWLRSAESPSIVVIFLLAVAEMGKLQERCGSPFTCTVRLRIERCHNRTSCQSDSECPEAPKAEEYP